MKKHAAKLPPTPWGQLPPILQLLFIASPHHTGGWLADAFAADNAADVVMEEAIGITAGLARLREASFDTVLVDHDPAHLDALTVLDAIHTGSTQQQPIIVLGNLPESEMTALCFESGADGYVFLEAATTRALMWQVAREAERHRLITENHRLNRANLNQLGLERDEAERLIEQQQQLISRQVPLPGDAAEGVNNRAAVQDVSPWQPPPELLMHYRELLRAYVIMGAGNLGEEIIRLTRFLRVAKLTSRQTLQLHLTALAEMIQDLGSRSSRHILNRANLLALDVLIGLSDGLCSSASEAAESTETPAPGSVSVDPATVTDQAA